MRCSNRVLIFTLSGSQGLPDLDADHRHIVRMDKALSILGRRHRVTAFPFRGCVEDRVKIVIEEKQVFLNVVLPMGKPGNIQRLG